ncbi:MAG: methionyl-tRNA formyltransferase [Steroidobacteraceae bacterium]
MRVAFAGTPAFALPPLAALADSSHEIVGVLTQPDRPAGRGRKLTPSLVKEFAMSRGYEISQPATLRTEEGRESLRRWAPDVLVVVAYGLILPIEALTIPKFGCINIHASLLPRWRGAAPIQRAILEGDAETGVTIMQMDAGLDTGPMWLQRRVAIDDQDDAISLQDKLAALGAMALLETLELVADGRTQPIVQPADGASYARKIDKTEARIDWQRSAVEIDRQIRAFKAWPVAETTWRGEILRIHRAHPIGDAVSMGSAHAPGTCVDTADGALQIACGQGCLAITELQRSGKRSVSAAEFLNGIPGGFTAGAEQFS